MSRKYEGLLANMLGDRWSLTAAPAAGATIVASVSAPQSAVSRHIMDALSISLINFSGAAHTVMFEVRAASVGGTLLWNLELMPASAGAAEVDLSGLGIAGEKGKAMFVRAATFLASVKATVNASGWTDISSDY